METGGGVLHPVRRWRAKISECGAVSFVGLGEGEGVRGEEGRTEMQSWLKPCLLGALCLCGRDGQHRYMYVGLVRARKTANVHAN